MQCPASRYAHRRGVVVPLQGPSHSDGAGTPAAGRRSPFQSFGLAARGTEQVRRDAHDFVCSGSHSLQDCAQRKCPSKTLWLKAVVWSPTSCPSVAVFCTSQPPRTLF